MVFYIFGKSLSIISQSLFRVEKKLKIKTDYSVIIYIKLMTFKIMNLIEGKTEVNIP